MSSISRVCSSIILYICFRRLSWRRSSFSWNYASISLVLRWCSFKLSSHFTSASRTRSCMPCISDSRCLTTPLSTWIWLWRSARIWFSSSILACNCPISRSTYSSLFCLSCSSYSRTLAWSASFLLIFYSYDSLSYLTFYSWSLFIFETVYECDSVKLLTVSSLSLFKAFVSFRSCS